MRDRQATIEALRRLAERPGTPHEGDTARRLLERMGAPEWVVTELDASLFPVGTEVFYCYWCYRNDRAVVRSLPKTIQGQQWIRMKFDRLKQARWVPVTSHVGCHIAREPFTGNVEETLYRKDVDWAVKDAEFKQWLRECGITEPRPLTSPIAELAA